MMDLITLVLACSVYADNSIPYAMIQTGSKNNPLVVTTNHVSEQFKTESKAIRYVQKQISQGTKVEIGLMQIPSEWLAEFGAHEADLFGPCKNLVVATEIMNTLRFQCQKLLESNPRLNITSCMLSLYKKDNSQTGLAYASQIMDYATKHPFSPLADKARDPGMLAAVAKPKTLAHITSSLTAKTKPQETTR